MLTFTNYINDKFEQHAKTEVKPVEKVVVQKMEIPPEFKIMQESLRDLFEKSDAIHKFVQLT